MRSVSAGARRKRLRTPRRQPRPRPPSPSTASSRAPSGYIEAMSASGPDAVVVGSGPNGLAAAIEIARTGRSVVVYEAAAEIGGGTRSLELTQPGFLHDVCSTVHPLLLASPFFQSLPLDELGIELAHPEVQFAHPLDDGSAVEVHRSVEETATAFGPDAKAYIRLMRPLVERVDDLMEGVLAPFKIPKHPILMARFGL